jgi:hypothetical protein
MPNGKRPQTFFLNLISSISEICLCLTLPVGLRPGPSKPKPHTVKGMDRPNFRDAPDTVFAGYPAGRITG